MGRPLNKKYFGNKAAPYTDFQGLTTPDSGTGAEGVASVTLDAVGAYTTRPTVTFSDPQLPGGVKATGTVTSEAVSAVVTAGGTGYLVGDKLTVTTAGGVAVFEVATLTGDGNTGAVATVTLVDGGSFTTLASSAQATTTDSVAGANATLTVTYQAKEVVITLAGSGYTSAPTATFTESVTASAVTLTSTAPAAILATAFVTGGGAKAADIIKQVNDCRYKVETADGVGVCQLVTDGAPNSAGEMTISATDGSGKTYYVAKLTSRKAVLVPYGLAGHEFASGTAAKWSLTAASTANGVVKLDTI